MSAALPKPIKIFGARVKLETTQGTDAVTSATDAVLLAENPKLTISYANDGKRPAPPGTLGHLKKAAPTGRVGDVPLKLELKGAGAAYSASVTPAGHALLRAAGFDAAVTVTGGAEKYVYTRTPGPTGFASVTGDLYSRGQLYKLLGALSDFSIGATGPEIPMLEFALKGLLSGITDVAVPTMTYGTQGTLTPPKAISMAFTVNGVANLVVKSWSYKQGRGINPRLNQNAANGHAGFAGLTFAPTFEFTIENEALATIDLYSLYDAATPFVLAGGVGATQYNKMTLAMPVAQIIDISDEDDDPAALIKVTCQLNPSALGSNDEISITFD